MSIPIIDAGGAIQAGSAQTTPAANLEVEVTALPQPFELPIANGTVLFEWNGFDLSQFEPAASFASGGWVPALSVAADPDSPTGNVLRLTSTGTGTGAAVWLALPSLPFADVARRIRFELGSKSLTSISTGIYAGPVFCADTTAGLHCIGDLNGQAGWQLRVDAGALQLVADQHGGEVFQRTGTNPDQSGSQVTTLVDKPAAGPPRGYIHGLGAQGTVDLAKSWNFNEPSWPVFPASWNALACNRFGLAVAASGGATAPTWDITDFRIIAL